MRKVFMFQGDGHSALAWVKVGSLHLWPGEGGHGPGVVQLPLPVTAHGVNREGGRAAGVLLEGRGGPNHNPHPGAHPHSPITVLNRSSEPSRYTCSNGSYHNDGLRGLGRTKSA